MRRPSRDVGHRHRRLALGGAALAAAAALALEPAAESSFATHMVQHLLLIVVVAPLLVAGLRLELPVPALVCWAAFAIVMWVSHLTSIYDAALDHQLAHAAEHVAFLGAAVLFWSPVMTGGRPYPMRLAYLALALPQQAFLALAIYSATTPIYDHYPSLADQRAGAVVMWVAGDLALIAAIALTVGAWMRSERAL